MRVFKFGSVKEVNMKKSLAFSLFFLILASSAAGQNWFKGTVDGALDFAQKYDDRYDEALEAAKKAVETAGDQAARYEKRIKEIEEPRAKDKKK